MAGIQVHKHYCGGYLAEMSLYLASNPCADEQGEATCHKKQKKKCCDDEVEFSQLDLDFLSKHKNEIQRNSAALLATFSENFSISCKQLESNAITQYRAPPEALKKKLFLLHQNWTYYL